MTSEQARKIEIQRLEIQLKRVLTMVNNINLQLSELQVIGVSPEGVESALKDVQRKMKKIP